MGQTTYIVGMDNVETDPGKCCTKCGEWKPLEGFVVNKLGKLGRKSVCRICTNAAENVRRQLNLDTYQERGRKWHENNQDRSRENSRKWHSENKEKRREILRRSMAKHRSTLRGRLENTLRCGVRRGLKTGSKFGRRTCELLDFTVSELIIHLEKQFQPGMSWENYGEWHVDHVHPLAEHEYETPDCEGFKKAWALSNLQPLWALDNKKKGSRILDEKIVVRR